MAFWHNFIDWTNNIEHLNYYGIYTQFDAHISDFKTLKKEVFELFSVVPDEKLRKKLTLNDIIYEEQYYGGGCYTAELDYGASGLPIIQPRFGLSENIIPSRKINNISCLFQMSQINAHILNGLSFIKGMSFMILYNPRYHSWENNHSPEAYKYKGGIKTYFCDAHKIKKVDLSDRPGRITGIGNITFHGGSEFWFGPSFYKYVPKERILEFEHADLVEELPNNIIHIKLMDIKDYWTGEGQGRLSDLRYQLNIDSLEKAYQASLAR